MKMQTELFSSEKTLHTLYVIRYINYDIPTILHVLLKQNLTQ